MSKIATDQGAVDEADVRGGAAGLMECAGFVPLAECWVCGGREFQTVFEADFQFKEWSVQDPELAAYTGQKIGMQRCRSCGFVEPTALPALADYFSRMYDQRHDESWMRLEAESRAKDLIFRTILRHLHELRPPSRALLDVGTHVGRLLRVAAGLGWEAEGVELNPRTAAFAATSSGRPVHQRAAEALSAEGRRYGAVTLVDVLEHIPAPVKALAGLQPLLARGGWLAVKVPCGPAQRFKEIARAWLRPGYRPDLATNLIHINHFTPRTLQIALERAGFENVRVATAPPELPGAESETRLGRASDLLRLGVYHVARLLPGGVSSPLSLNLVAYARAPQ